MQLRHRVGRQSRSSASAAPVRTRHGSKQSVLVCLVLQFTMHVMSCTCSHSFQVNIIDEFCREAARVVILAEDATVLGKASVVRCLTSLCCVTDQLPRSASLIFHFVSVSLRSSVVLLLCCRLRCFLYDVLCSNVVGYLVYIATCVSVWPLALYKNSSKSCHFSHVRIQIPALIFLVSDNFEPMLSVFERILLCDGVGEISPRSEQLFNLTTSLCNWSGSLRHENLLEFSTRLIEVLESDVTRFTGADITKLCLKTLF